MSTQKRTHRMEKLARIYDDEILPLWSERFGKMIMRGLSLPEKGQFLDVDCATGYPGLEIARKMGEKNRLIAIDSSSALLDIARKKVEKQGIKGVFFRTENAEPKLSFANDVYDLVICNLALADFSDPAAALLDFARVTAPGGEIRCTLPLSGTFEEFFDIYRGVLEKHDKHETLKRLQTHIQSTYPSAAMCKRWLEMCKLNDAEVVIEEFTLLFKSSREFFFSPLIEFGPLPKWKAVAGAGQEMQDVFWYIKEAIDAYFDGRAFEVTIKAGLLKATKPAEGEVDDTALVELPASKPVGERTEELDLVDLEEANDAVNDAGDEEIDAFVDGRERPAHLDD